MHTTWPSAVPIFFYACKQRIHNSKYANIKCAQDELHYRIKFFLKIGKVGADTMVEGKEFQREVV